VNTKTRVPISRPDLGRAEQLNVNEVMHHGWISQGPFVTEAEERLCRITGRQFAICTSSGSVALIVALMATIRWKPWTVSAPALTFAAVHNAIKLVGGSVRLEGCNAQSWQVEYKNDSGQADSTIAAPCYGKLEGMDVITESDLPVIEDAAESFTGSLNGKPAGSFGLISCVSFYVNKCITSGEGGALLTDDLALALRMRGIANHGIVDKSYAPVMTGTNARMTDLQAAVLCAQLDRLPQMLKRRRQIMDLYVSAARGRWKLPTIAPGEVCAPWLFAGIPEDRAETIRRCETENIEWRPFFPVFDIDIKYDDPLMENARQISRSGICLPLSSALTDEEVRRVCEVISG
jgi:perosamine synthetase